jgi:bacterioferritin (cytochrome b1)
MFRQTSAANSQAFNRVAGVCISLARYMQSDNMSWVAARLFATSKDAKDMLRYDLDNENETIRNYRERVPQCEALGEYAMAEQIRQF